MLLFLLLNFIFTWNELISFEWTILRTKNLLFVSYIPVHKMCLTTLSMKLATSARLPADTDNAHLHHGCTVIFLLDESLHDLPIQWKSQTDLSREKQAALSFLHASLLILTTLDKRTRVAGKWFVANVSLPTIDIRRIFTDSFFFNSQFLFLYFLLSQVSDNNAFYLIILCYFFFFNSSSISFIEKC